MNNQELRKFGKKELLEILLSQAKRIEELEEELTKTKKKLESKKITIENSGSLAEASLKLNNIFEAAEASAEQYLLNIKEKCKKLDLDTKNKTNKMLKETELLCKKKKEEADAYLAEIKLKSKELTKSKSKPTIVNKKIVKNNKSQITNSNNNNTKIRIEKMKKEL